MTRVGVVVLGRHHGALQPPPTPHLPTHISPASPSMMGSRSRCTPSLDASAPYRYSLLVTILSISSMNTMPAGVGVGLSGGVGGS